MHRIVRTVDEFQDHWSGLHNFLLADQCKPFAFDFPPLEQVVDILRHDPAVKVFKGHTRLGKHPVVDITNSFRDQSLEEVVHSAYLLRHMNALKFDRSGDLLDGFDQGVIRPLYEMLMAAGFTWQRCLVYLFCSGPGCNSTLHMDRSHVIAWQVYGVKYFAGFKEPARWATREVRRAHVIDFEPEGFDVPAQAMHDDWLSYEMQPGDALWNAFHTLHTVTGGSEPSLSVNISLGGLRYRGCLCPHETDVLQFADEAGRQGRQSPVSVG